MLNARGGQDPTSHFGWHLYYFCHLHDVYNSTTCSELQSVAPKCLELIELGYMDGSVEKRNEALNYCNALKMGDTHGRVLEDIRRVVRDVSTPCLPALILLLSVWRSLMKKILLRAIQSSGGRPTLLAIQRSAQSLVCLSMSTIVQSAWTFGTVSSLTMLICTPSARLLFVCLFLIQLSAEWPNTTFCMNLC